MNQARRTKARAGRGKSSKRLLLIALVLALTVLMTAGGTLMLVFLDVGRSPGELIHYAKFRLEGHTRLQAVFVPVLDALGGWFGEPDAVELALPFAIPPVAQLVPPAPPAPAGGTPGPASSGDPMRILVGAHRAVTSLAVAASVAPDGAVIEVDPGDYPADVAVWHQKALTIRGMGPGVRLIASGLSAEGKGIWVLRNGVFLVENIAFVGARVADQNGAGIRLEGGDLTVRHCQFFDSDSGILTAAGPDTRLTVENSEFGYLGYGDGRSHNIYVGAIGYFRLSGSYLHHGNIGHLVKSRARVNRIEYNRITDEAGGRASYEVEFPNGGDATVVGNIVQQGSGTRNSVIVAYGLEGYTWPVNSLKLVHNTLVNDLRLGGLFLRVAPGPTPKSVLLRNNLLVGGGKIDAGPSLDEAGDVSADWSFFVQPTRQDFTLTPDARGRLAAQPLAAVPEGLQPRQAYRHLVQTTALPEPLRFPGALPAAAP